jgi:hypothetical protein
MRENPFSSQYIKKIWIAGLIVGSLDILAAFVDAWISFKLTPGRILTLIAGGAIGYGNAKGGFPLILLGLLIHFFIAYCYTFFFYFICSYLRSLFKNSLVIGILYGLFIWATMRFVILPVFSQVRFEPFDILKAIKPMLILIGAIGIPLSFMMKRINTVE